MPLSPPDPLEVRTKSSFHPIYWLAATARNTTSLTRHACDIYEEIENGETGRVWNQFQLARANELRQLYRLSTGQGGADVFKGGHVVLNDNAAWYYHWAAMVGQDPAYGAERWSSHYDKSRKYNMFSRELQFEIYFPWNGIHMNWGVLLFGRYQAHVGNYWEVEDRTWFQTEAHSSTRPGAEGVVDPVLHIATGWIPYKLTGQNVGPRGLSIHTEAAPVLNPAPPAPPPATGNLAAAQVAFPDIVATQVPGVAHRRRTYTSCVVCGLEHGFFRSVVHHWHRCVHCDRVYCPDHGYALAFHNQGYFAAITDRTRRCANCAHRTELIQNVVA